MAAISSHTEFQYLLCLHFSLVGRIWKLKADTCQCCKHAVLSQYLFPTRKSGYLELQGQELAAASLQSSQEPSCGHTQCPHLPHIGNRSVQSSSSTQFPTQLILQATASDFQDSNYFGGYLINPTRQPPAPEILANCPN